MGLPRRYQDRPFTLTEGVVAIAITPTEDDTHSGLLFINEDDQVCALHLAFHSTLCVEIPPADWDRSIWAVPELLPERAEAVAALCDLVGRLHKQKGLPYALKYAEGVFDTGTGEVQLGPGCVGFTCSTFVRPPRQRFRSDSSKPWRWGCRSVAS